MLLQLLTTALLAVHTGLAQAAPPDYAEYQSLLNRYLVRLQPESPTTDTRFDYERLYLDEKIHYEKRSAVLQRIRDQLLAVNPSELPAAERTAWAINTYNFLVMERATMHLLVPRKRFVRYRSVDDMRAPDGPFFAARLVTIDGVPLTLGEFERRWVHGDTTATARGRALPIDPRRSLALCSGHVGDPPLAPRAYRGDSLEAQLDAAARSALAQPRFLALQDEGRRLNASNYLARRADGFEGGADGLVPFIERFGPPEVRKAIRRHHIQRVTLAMPEDRMLNQWPRPPKNAGPAPMSTGS